MNRRQREFRHLVRIIQHQYAGMDDEEFLDRAVQIFMDRLRRCGILKDPGQEPVNRQN